MGGEQEVDLFGEKVEYFKPALERYGVWPTTVWDCNMQDPVTQKLKDMIGDGCSARQGSGSLGYMSKSARAECFTKASDDKSTYRGKITESIFNPAVAAWCLNMYAPKDGVCFDPFAGGGTRAIMAAKHGMQYVGVELRQEEVDAVNQRCRSNGVADRVTLHNGDSRNARAIIGKPDGWADFLITCPPYWNLEKYDGGEADLSMAATPSDFEQGLLEVVGETRGCLKPGAFSCWVIGLHRDEDEKGELLPLHHFIANVHRNLGFRFKEEIILHQRNNGAIQRVGQFEKGDRRLVRVHEYLLVFVR